MQSMLNRIQECALLLIGSNEVELGFLRPKNKLAKLDKTKT